MARHSDPFGAKVETTFDGQSIRYWRLSALDAINKGQTQRLPFSIKVLLESVLRQLDNFQVTEQDIRSLANWAPDLSGAREVPFKPARVVLQDFTGVPSVVDLASMRDVVAKTGGDAARINPIVPVDLVIDHSVQVDEFGQPAALEHNMDYEFARNHERYRFLKWAQSAFSNLRVIPPDTGIVHQVNLEYLASVVATKKGQDGLTEVFPDTVVGTDSHTTMVNGLGVLGWGVGGIEAEANMLGQPLYFLTPAVIGVQLTGQLATGATATDLALTVTQLLRQKGVVGKFVEFFGPGISALSLADRATVANMAPEYGATMGYFPVDRETLRYLRQTGRPESHIRLIEWYLTQQGLFRHDNTPDPVFSDVIVLDLSTVVPSLAGPKRPQDRVPLTEMQSTFESALTAPVAQRGFGLSSSDISRSASLGNRGTLSAGSVVLASITSCTNTSNPAVMLTAGLLARNAVERGLTPPPFVKTSLAPGSRVVSAYLEAVGLLDPLSRLGFNVVGYGCMTCIGNSGPLPDDVATAIQSHDLTVAAVLSGNRNFEGRIHALIKANYLASPPLVIAYALAGTVDIDLLNDPIGYDNNQQPVYLADLWPTPKELDEVMAQALQTALFTEAYSSVENGNARWNQLSVPEGHRYAWQDTSTYIQNPPYFDGWHPGSKASNVVNKARVLAIFGDSVTTDHISPAGNIAPDSPAAQYLAQHGVERKDFNSYGSRRGNHEVMMRGTFANIRIRNQMLPDTEGGYTIYWPSHQTLTIFEAAERYQKDGTPLVVLAGKEYGTGSSRDWAAKGPALLGVKVVIAQSFERIHRSNLVGMGILPLEFLEGQSAQTLGLTGEEIIEVVVPNDLRPRQQLSVSATGPDGQTKTFSATVRLDTPVDVEYYRQGGILPTVLTNILQPTH